MKAKRVAAKKSRFNLLLNGCERSEFLLQLWEVQKMRKALLSKKIPLLLSYNESKYNAGFLSAYEKSLLFSPEQWWSFKKVNDENC